MTKEDKELLFIDLCARLPYGVKVKVIEYDDFNDVEVLDCYYLNRVHNKFYSIKPYLFPMSSMKDEQEKELLGIGRSLQFWDLINEISDLDCVELIDWLNKNHFDYRGLIPKNLAIDATNLNIY